MQFFVKQKGVAEVCKLYWHGLSNVGFLEDTAWGAFCTARQVASSNQRFASTEWHIRKVAGTITGTSTGTHA